MKTYEKVNLRLPCLENGTVLWRAVNQNDIGLVSLLLKRRASLDLLDDLNRGAIDLAQECEDAYVLTTLRYHAANSNDFLNGF